MSICSWAQSIQRFQVLCGISTIWEALVRFDASLKDLVEQSDYCESQSCLNLRARSGTKRTRPTERGRIRHARTECIFRTLALDLKFCTRLLQILLAILGSYSSNMGQNENDASGKAVIATQSAGNAAAMPYIIGYLAGINQMAIIHADLLPKYIKGKRKLPVMDNAGKRDYAQVNDHDSPKLDYGNHALSVCIEAGVNFQVQKSEALAQITSMMQASEEFAQFMNDDETLPILVDNITCYGADRLKEAVPKWIEKKSQMQQQAQQMQQEQMQNDPAMMRARADLMKVQIEAQNSQFDQQIQIAKQATEDKLADAKILESEAKVTQAQIDSAVRLEESNTSLERHALDAAAKIAEVKGREHDMTLKTHAAHLSQKELEYRMENSKNENT